MDGIEACTMDGIETYTMDAGMVWKLPPCLVEPALSLGADSSLVVVLHVSHVVASTRGWI